MNRTIHQACVWAAAPMAVILGVALVVAGLFPPPSPDVTAAEVASHYVGDQVRVQIGLVLGMLGSGLWVPFAGALAWEAHKMAGRRNAVGAIIQVICGGAVLMAILIPFLVWMAAAFRADRDPELILAIHDLGWILFIAPVSFAAVEFLVLGLGMLLDRQPTPTFPRWFGYLSIFLALDFFGGGFIVLTHTGPFAWNGIFAYYVPFGLFFVWVGIAVVYLSRSVTREWDELEPVVHP